MNPLEGQAMSEQESQQQAMGGETNARARQDGDVLPQEKYPAL
jgi:hypothetical protein